MVKEEEEDEKKKKEDEEDDEEEERTKHGDDLTMFVTTQHVLFIFSNSSTNPLFLNPHILKNSKIVNPNKYMNKVISHNCRIK